MDNLAKLTTEGQCVAVQRQTLRERLEERKRMAEEHLGDVCKALEFLDQNQNFEAFHNLIGRAGF